MNEVVESSNESQWDTAKLVAQYDAHVFAHRSKNLYTIGTLALLGAPASMVTGNETAPVLACGSLTVTLALYGMAAKTNIDARTATRAAYVGSIKERIKIATDALYPYATSAYPEITHISQQSGHLLEETQTLQSIIIHITQQPIAVRSTLWHTTRDGLFSVFQEIDAIELAARYTIGAFQEATSPQDRPTILMRSAQQILDLIPATHTMTNEVAQQYKLLHRIANAQIDLNKVTLIDIIRLDQIIRKNIR